MPARGDSTQLRSTLENRRKGENASRPVVCPICGDSFSRKGHLSRHLSKHSDTKSFQCTHCKKSFPRKDTLLRHVSIHVRDEQEQTQWPALTVKKRNQACGACASSKQRCCGGIPCERCISKGLDCKIVLRAAQDHQAMQSPLVDDTQPSTLQIPATHASNLPDMSGVDADFGNNALNSVAMASDPPAAVGSSQIPPYLAGMSVPANPDLASFAVDTNATQTFQSSVANFDPTLYPWALHDFDFVSFWQDSFEAPSEISNDVMALENTNIPPEASMQIDPSTASRQSPRSGSTLLGPGLERPPEIFPAAQPEDELTAAAEDYHHISSMNLSEYFAIMNFFESRHPGTQQRTFPTLSMMNAFVQLYFEYCQEEFPCIHPATLRQQDRPWILLLALATMGSHYSAITDAHYHTLVLLELLEQALQTHFPQTTGKVTMQYAQSALLRDICLFFAGSSKAQYRWQCERNRLVVLCRVLCRARPPADLNPALGDYESKWHAWIDTEARNRLMHCVFSLDCWAFLLSNFQPVVQLNELPNKLPCPDGLWRCQSVKEWLAMTGSQGFNRASEQKGGFDKHIQFFVRCMQERHLLLVLSHCCFEQHKSVDTRDADRSYLDAYKPASGNIADVLVAQQLQSSLKRMVGSLSQEPRSSAVIDDGHDYHDLTSHTVAILRHVSLSTLLSATGWYVSEAETEKAIRDARAWIQREPALSRLCLWRAAAVFGALRSKRYFACHDPLTLMYSVLYIQLFDRLAPKPLGSTTHYNSGAMSLNGQPIRLDRPTSDQAVHQWLKRGGDGVIHITGIGLLQTHDSPQRIWHGCQRVLTGSKAWWTLCQSIASAIGSCIKGNRPAYWDESGSGSPLASTA